MREAIHISTMFSPFKSPEVKTTSNPSDLKKRLDWGEPGLTIIDVRDREAFNESHIMGAISLPTAELVARASYNLEKVRDIYLYGNTDEETAAAASQLREAGYKNVSELKGGLAAWKASKYQIEGISEVV